MQTIDKDYDFLFKIILIGNQKTGKSNLLLKFCDNNFNEAYEPTIGVEFKTTTLNLEEKIGKLQLWDTTGQERFRAVTSSYYRNALGIILKSFKNIENWLTEVEKFANENVVKLLVGNKSNLEGERQVSKEEGQAMAKTLGVIFLETSAKDSSNVKNLFLTTAENIRNNLQQR